MSTKTADIYPYTVHLDVLGAMPLFVNWWEIFRGSSERDQRGKYERPHTWRHQYNEANNGESRTAYPDENAEKANPESSEEKGDNHPSQSRTNGRKSHPLPVSVTRPVHKRKPRHGTSLRRVDTPLDLT